MMQVTDIHYDLAYDIQGSLKSYCRLKEDSQNLAKYGRYGCDTPLDLLTTMFDDAAQQNAKEKFNIVFMLGDFGSHGVQLQQNQAIKTISDLISTNFPDSIKHAVLGNNDGNGNYNFSLEKNDQHLKEIYTNGAMKQLINNDKFLEFGYYSNDLDEHKIKLIGLNSIFYTTSMYKKNYPTIEIPDDPGNQFQFLIEQLQDCRDKNYQAIVTYHNCFGLNGFDGSVTAIDKFTIRHREIVNQFKDIIIFEQMGHYHHDDFRLTSKGRDTHLVSYLLPSISPSNHNNPAYRITELSLVDNKWVVSDYEQRYIDLVEANTKQVQPQFEHQYKFSELYEVFTGDTQPNAKTHQKLNQKMKTDEKLYSVWTSQSNTLYRPSRAQYMCGLRSIDKVTYDTCVQNYKYD
ncbi:Acid_sphingomyelinase [Hexamita inflata]|uniref:Acid sphingomyelinase n=1 Tax=Hexamita inflata TaxID=28002 RepID=A0AA86RF11_9EUKA|nr:Acid sphingomyelinase [Hexamita inflata]